MREILLCLALTVSAYCQDTFKVIVLGSGGGPLENNLSSYLLAPTASSDYIALDAGTLLSEIVRTEENPLAFFQNQIKAYLISHPHLDHVAGLVINSTADSKKPLLGTDFTINSIRDHLFNWIIWPNFGSEGKKPLNQYAYKRLKEGKKSSIPSTAMSVEALLLNHPKGYLSTAFLIEASGAYVLYCGDTSPDERLEKVWKKVAPLIRDESLSAIFLECSYLEAEPLMGHVDTQSFMRELGALARLVDPAHPSLKKCSVIVTHIKETLKGPSLIQEELDKLNELKIPLIFPKQGQLLSM